MTDIDYNVVAQGLRDQIERFTGALEKEHAAHEADIQTISDALIAEAESRGWCEEYEKLVASLDASLHKPLIVRHHTYKVVEWYTVTRLRYISASSEEAALAHPALSIAEHIHGLNSPEYGSYSVRIDRRDIDIED